MSFIKNYCFLFLGLALYSFLLAICLKALVGRITYLEKTEENFYERIGFSKKRKRTLQILCFVCLGISILCSLIIVFLLYFLRFFI